MHHQDGRERHPDLGDEQRPGRRRVRRPLRDPVRRGDGHHPAHPLRPQPQRADRRAGQRHRRARVRGDRGEEDVLYALSTANCPRACPTASRGTTGRGRWRWWRWTSTASRSPTTPGRTSARAPGWPTRATTPSAAAHQPGAGRQHRTHPHRGAGAADDRGADGESHARHRSHAPEPILDGGDHERHLARPARIGSHHRRDRDAHPGDPELLLRPPVAARDDDRSQLQGAGAGRGPGRGGARARAGRRADRRRARTAASSKWTDPGNRAPTPAAAPGSRSCSSTGSGWGRGTTRRSSTTTAAPSCPTAIQDASCSRGVAGPRHERDGGRHGVGDGGERPRAGPRAGDSGDRQPLEARLLQLEPGQSPGLLQRAGEPERKPQLTPGGPERVPERSRRLRRPAHGRSSGARRSIRPSTGTLATARRAELRYPYPSGKRLVIGDRHRRQLRRRGHAVPGILRLRADHAVPGRYLRRPARAACVHGRGHPHRRDSRTSASNAPAGAAPTPGWCSRETTHSAPTTGRAAPTGARVRDAARLDEHGSASPIQGATFYGTVVIEGNGQAGCSGASRDISAEQGTNGRPRRTARPNVYGYPLAFLVFDPVRAVPTASQPVSHPQETCADMGSGSGTVIHGIVYSGGDVEFNPITVNGGVVAFEIQTQGGRRTTPTTRRTAMPRRRPASRAGAATPWSWSGSPSSSACNYAADTGGGSPCQ